MTDIQSANFTDRRRRISYIVLLQAIAGLVFLGIGWSLGGLERLHLMRAGVRVLGTIVDSKTIHSRTATQNMTDISYAAIVRFSADGRVIEFRDRMGSKIAPAKK